MSADWTIRVSDCDGDVEDWLKALTYVKVLGIAADEDRHRLEVSCGLAGLPARRRTRGLSCDHGFARRHNRIKFGLQFGFGGRQSRRKFDIANAAAFALASSACSLASADDADASARSEASSCASALSFRFSATRTGTIACAATREALKTTSLASSAFFVASSASAARAAATAPASAFGWNKAG
jgi:hypothetical protein